MTQSTLEFAIKSSPGFSDQVQESYNRLPVDEYLQSDQRFRYRRFSRVRFSDNKPLPVVEDTSFFQEQSINHYAGGVSRKYEHIEPDILKELVGFCRDNLLTVFGVSEVEFGLHQIRITCGKDFVGYPVPEGWHKDGFDYIAMACVSARNMVGGISRVRENLTDDRDFFCKILEPDELMILNDRCFYHYTDPINAADQEGSGYRDILVITISIGT